MPSPREATCLSTAAKLRELAHVIPTCRALVGLDGFVDEIIAIVDVRHADGGYDPVRTIARFAEKIAREAGRSSNYEMVIKQTKLGGNGPIMANALAAAGLAMTYVGSLGSPQLHPVFTDLAQRATVHSISEPGYTEALEFDDGKLMLGKHGSLGNVNWSQIEKIVGEQPFVAAVEEADLVALVNWTMLPQMSAVWREMLARGIPSRRPGRRLFVDLADPEKRTAESIRAALDLVTQFGRQVDVTLGLNLKESLAIGEVLGLAAPPEPEKAIEASAREIRERLKIACVVIHPRGGAAAATADGSATVAGPFIERPKISTGAGDHFNAGFCLGQTLGLALEECLCAGVATSGYYVRTAESPTAAQLADFISELPGPEA